MNEIKLVAFDLDGTLLDDLKNIPDENLEALNLAREKGIYLVPATGRLYKAVPEIFKKLCRYFMLINGGKVYDSLEDKIIYESSLPWDLALKVYEEGDTQPCIYDAYIADSGCMTRSMWDVFEDYVFDKNYVKSMKPLREPVPDLKEKIRTEHCPVQKAQFFYKDLDIRDREIIKLEKMFPELHPTISLGSNIEINTAAANKGAGLRALCAYLGFESENAVAFGDGTNDLDMLIEAGTGVCMANGAEKCKAAADIITEYDNNSAGLGKALKKLL